MNRFCFLLFLFVTSVTMYSQNEIIKDSSVINKGFSHNEISKDLIIHQTPLINSEDIKLVDREPYNEAEIKLPNYLNYKLELSPDLRPRKLFSTLSYSLNEYNYTYGIGNYRHGGIELIYKPIDKLTILMGGDVVNYNILHSRYNDILFNFNATYQFTDWMYLSVFGQYSVNSLSNARFGGYMLAPQSSYGAVLRFKTSEKVDLNVGVERVFNSLTKS